MKKYTIILMSLMIVSIVQLDASWKKPAASAAAAASSALAGYYYRNEIVPAVPAVNALTFNYASAFHKPTMDEFKKIGMNVPTFLLQKNYESMQNDESIEGLTFNELKSESNLSITDYVASRDEASILSMLENNNHQLNYGEGSASVCLFSILEKYQGRIKILRKDDITIGFCAYNQEPIFNEDDTISNYYGNVDYIVVDQKHRKNGYASKMLQFVIDDLSSRKVCEIVLQVRRNNSSAIALYKKNGFEFVENHWYVDDVNSNEFVPLSLSRIDYSLCGENYEILTR